MHVHAVSLSPPTWINSFSSIFMHFMYLLGTKHEETAYDWWWSAHTAQRSIVQFRVVCKLPLSLIGQVYSTQQAKWFEPEREIIENAAVVAIAEAKRTAAMENDWLARWWNDTSTLGRERNLRAHSTFTDIKISWEKNEHTLISDDDVKLWGDLNAKDFIAI